MILSWNEFTNLENSLFEFLEDALNQSGGLQVINDKGVAVDINLRIGHTPDDTWTLPVISFYEDSRTAPRGFVGSNLRIKTKSLIIDIRCFNDAQRSDLTSWIESQINDGFPYYVYTKTNDPNNPTTTLSGHVAIEFVTNNPLRLGNNVDLIDRYRQNITISCFVEENA